MTESRVSFGESPPVFPTAERRQLSVLFCDLVGLPSLSARLDPEDLREIIGDYHRLCGTVIAKADGFVAKYMGEGVLAYFGYPNAHEDDAERAVSAALELIDAVHRLDAGLAKLQARIGIATGLVVVGDVIGEGPAQEQAVVGWTPNLAARLQSKANPGTVAIAEGTRRLLGGLFEYRELGRVALKGFAEPVPAFQVLRPSMVASRFEARQQGGIPPLIGRAAELDGLLRLWRQSRSGTGQVVLISGEPGIGKSHLLYTMLQCIAAEPHQRLRGYCSPYHQDSALYPIIGHFERAAGFTRDDHAVTRLDKLDRLLARTSTSERDRALVAELLALPGAAERYPIPELTPTQRKQETLAALARQLEELAQEQPVLLSFEDLHWVDPTTLELLDRLVELVARLPVLLAMTFRSEFKPSWDGPHVSAVALNRLERSECEALIAQIARDALPADVVREIVKGTDGVPLFIEEITKAVLETELAGTRLQSGIPPSLHASFTARLDRLGPAKELAQIGSVIGREFSYELLANVAGWDDDELHLQLDRLSAAGLVFRRGTPPNTSFLFKHALVQGAAYSTLLRPVRQHWHARIAETIATRFVEMGNTQPELLAHHYAEAGSLDAAIDWWHRAAERALTRSANAEAVKHLQSALALLGRQAGSPERDKREVALRSRLARPLVFTTGFASRRTEENYTRTAQLTGEIDRSVEALNVLWGQSAMALVRSELSKADALAEKFIHLATRAELRNGPPLGHRLIGYAALMRGDIGLARRRFDISMQEYTPHESRFVFDDWQLDLYSGSMVQDVLVLQQEGLLDEAATKAQDALAEARRIGSPASEAYVLLHMGLSGLIANDVRQVERPANSLYELIERHDLEYWRWHAEALRGWVEARSGAVESGAARIRRALELRCATMANLWVPLYVLSEAEVFIHHGRPEEAFRIFGECETLIAELQQRYVEPELKRLRAVALHMTGADPPLFEAAFDLALEAAQRQGTRLYELRTRTSRARIWKGAGREREAYALLAPIRAGFDTSVATPDIRQADALLAQLAIARSVAGSRPPAPAAARD